MRSIESYTISLYLEAFTLKLGNINWIICLMIYHFVVDDLENEFLQPIVVGKLFPEGFQQFAREQEFLVLDRENAFQQVGNVFLLIELKFKI